MSALHPSQKPLHPSQRRLIKAFRAEFDRIGSDIRMDRVGRGLAHDVSTEERNLIVAQNALRTCIEATLDKLLPYGHVTPIDLGVRLASYCISALPVEEQTHGVETLAKVLRVAHPQRIAAGIRLSTSWEVPGQGERENFPEPNS